MQASRKMNASGLACGDAATALGQDALVMSRSGHDDDTPGHPHIRRNGGNLSRDLHLFLAVAFRYRDSLRGLLPHRIEVDRREPPRGGSFPFTSSERSM
jgi:hypothetical protein